MQFLDTKKQRKKAITSAAQWQTYCSKRLSDLEKERKIKKKILKSSAVVNIRIVCVCV